MISNKNLVQLLEKVGWVNDVMFEENVYLNLVKAFYSNMDTFVETQYRIITHVGGVKIEFYVSVLNEILGTPDEGLEIYSVRKPLICRHIDLFFEVCTIHLHTQCLCVQSRVSLRILQIVVTPKLVYVNKIYHMDVALLDCILRGLLINIRYVITRHMLSILGMVNCSFHYDNFITRILNFFQVPIDEPNFNITNVIGDEIIYSLGFD